MEDLCLSSHKTEHLNRLLARKETLVLDGGLATELESRGHNLNHALWSAKLLLEKPEAIQQVHLDYFLAGADVAITASYQASVQGLKQHLDPTIEPLEIIQRSVRLAQQARDQAHEQGVAGPLLVAGSVGPYGAYLADGSEYTGAYHLSLAEFQNFHRERIRALVDMDVDLLACETMPSYGEIQALVALLREEHPQMPAWISCTLRNAEHISDGTPVSKVLDLIYNSNQVVAFGVNCVPQVVVTDALKHMKAWTDKPLVCYPNSGETYDATSKEWTGGRAEGSECAKRVAEWKASGARLIGGCCRTGPEEINITSKACSGALL